MHFAVSDGPAEDAEPIAPQIISFFLQHLTHNRNSDDVLCLDCSLSFLASQVGPDAAAVVAPLAPSRFRFVLAAVNDNLDPEVRLVVSAPPRRPDAEPRTSTPAREPTRGNREASANSSTAAAGGMRADKCSRVACQATPAPLAGGFRRVPLDAPHGAPPGRGPENPFPVCALRLGRGRGGQREPQGGGGGCQRDRPRIRARREGCAGRPSRVHASAGATPAHPLRALLLLCILRGSPKRWFVHGGFRFLSSTPHRTTGMIAACSFSRPRSSSAITPRAAAWGFRPLSSSQTEYPPAGLRCVASGTSGAVRVPHSLPAERTHRCFLLRLHFRRH